MYFAQHYLGCLSQASGAWIGYGSAAEAGYPIRHLADGERIVLGDVVLQVVHTPGHTPESISLLVYEHVGDEAPYGVLTGDALLYPGGLGEVSADRPVVAYCEGGWRSSVAASLLSRSGYPDVSDLLGGFAAWEAMHQPVSV